ncbi:MAG: RagB/SusD family nutrient uptake outer membrane protein [Balneolales bacterium]
MKKSKFIFIGILLSSILFHGCDGLNMTPAGSVSEDEFWQRDSDAEAAVMAVYSQLDDPTMVRQLDGVTDIAYRATSGPGTLHDVAGGNIVASNDAITSIWDRYYRGVRRANDVIAKIGTTEFGDPDKLNRIEAEARFLRAYYYTQLASLWGGVPLITEPIPITEEVGRTDRNVIVDFVIDELDDVISSGDLPPSAVGRATMGAAHALKARVALRHDRWAIARDASKAVMDMGIYELYPDYEGLHEYEGENSSEVIFDRQYASDGDTYNAFAYSAASIGGSSIVEPVNKFYEYFEFNGPGPDVTGDPYENIDPRWNYTVYYTGQPIGNSTYDSRPSSNTGDAVNTSEFSTQHGYNLKKGVDYENDNENSGNGSINMILIRYADVLLMYAEAKIELNEIDNTVYDAINKVRERPTVNMPPLTVASHGTQDELREALRRERVVELGFEGLRLFDMNRWELGAEKEGEVFGAHFYNNEGEEYLQSIGFSRSFEETDYLWPIPTSEMNSNSSITENNPGYN